MPFKHQPPRFRNESATSESKILQTFAQLRLCSGVEGISHVVPALYSDVSEAKPYFANAKVFSCGRYEEAVDRSACGSSENLPLFRGAYFWEFCKIALHAMLDTHGFFTLCLSWLSKQHFPKSLQELCPQFAMHSQLCFVCNSIAKLYSFFFPAPQNLPTILSTPKKSGSTLKETLA